MLNKIDIIIPVLKKHVYNVYKIHCKLTIKMLKHKYDIQKKVTKINTYSLRIFMF